MRGPHPSGSGSGSSDGRKVLWFGGFAFWGVLIAAYSGFGIPLLEAILLALLMGVMPTFAVGQARALDTVSFERLPAYWSSVVTLWVLGATSWLVGTRQGGAASVGLVWPGWGALAGWTVGLTLAGLAVMVLFRVWVGRTALRETRTLQRLLPRTPKERRVFALLSVAAGVGEELAYRGFAVPWVAEMVGDPGSVALTSIVFGVLHAYQGWVGVVRTALVGVVLATGLLASGSVVPGMIAHLLIDLIAGLVLTDWLMAKEETSVGSIG